MNVRILFFAQLREIFGRSEMTLTVQPDATVQDAVNDLIQERGNAKIDWHAVKYAVNEEFAPGSKLLRDEDTLVLLPPVSGG